MADTFRPVTNGLFFDVTNERTGEVVLELVDCIGDARWYCQDLAAADAEAEETERVALALEAAQAELPGHVIDFLHALDRGDFGPVCRFSDGSESAYVAALRSAVALFERRA